MWHQVFIDPKALCMLSRHFATDWWPLVLFFCFCLGRGEREETPVAQIDVELVL